MALLTNLTNRSTASTPQADTNTSTRQDDGLTPHRKASLDGRRDGKARSATPPAPLDTLRTLAVRLQAQIDGSDTDGDPEARALLGSVHRRLAQVNEALARIEEGKYGICVGCDKPIENDRLVLQPASVRCTTCQAVAEWRGLAY